METGPITRKILDTMKKVKPGRVFLDSISILQHLLNDAYQLRKQVLSFIEYINKHSASFVFTSEPTKNISDEQLRFLADGVINLEMEADSRYITISKFRGSEFRTGRHAFRLTGKGLVIFPRLIPGEHHRSLPELTMLSGVAGIDKLLGGGIERGTVTIITGPSGIGKTTLGLQFMNEAARNGYRSVIYLFEESKELLIKQSEGISIPTGSMIKGENLSVVTVEPLRYSSDEFAIMVRNEIEEKGAKIVMIDSVAGLILSIRDESVIERLHAIATYLRNMGTTLFFINEVENLTGDFRAIELNYSYLSDNIIFMKYVELQGELERVIGVLKKRLGNFEKSIREFQIIQDGLTVGEPLSDMKGILSGNP